MTESNEEPPPNTPSLLRQILEEQKSMTMQLREMRTEQGERLQAMVNALVLQNRVPVATLDKVVDANIRERKVWMTAMFIMLLVFLGLRTLAPNVLVGN